MSAGDRVAPGISPRNIPSLDGLRAISVILVLLGHLEGTRGFVALQIGGVTLQNVAGDFALLGVRVFFVISGFLITRLLIEEHEERGAVSLRLFYLRRALRILPAFFAYMIVVVLFVGLGAAPVGQRDLIHAFTYTVNYQHHPAWLTGHLWSLSVEEQFYLLWPFAVAAFGPQRAMVAAVACLLIGPGARASMRLFVDPAGYLPSFPTVADALAAGCLLAGLRERAWQIPTYRRTVSWRGLLWIAPMVLAVLNRSRTFTIGWVIGDGLQNLIIALVLDRAVSFPADGPARALNLAPLAWLGRLSYSLYLWQQLFLNRHSTALMNSFPLNVALAALAATASFYLLERPLMRLRARLRPIVLKHDTAAAAAAS